MTEKSQVERQFEQDMQAQREQERREQQANKRNPSVQLALNGTPIYMNNLMTSVANKKI